MYFDFQVPRFISTHKMLSSFGLVQPFCPRNFHVWPAATEHRVFWLGARERRRPEGSAPLPPPLPVPPMGGHQVDPQWQAGCSSTKPPSEELVEELARQMPALAGRPLERPCFHETGWRPGQRFTAAEDPDRTRMPWAPPAFALEGSAGAAQREHLTAEADELELPTGAAGSFARVVRGVLCDEECAELLAHVNAKGFTPALVNMGGDLQQLMPHYRDGHRVIVDSPEVAARLFEALRPHLPDQLPNGSRLVELNERLRFLCYTPGQSFDEHYDGCYRRPLGHPRMGDRSYVTVQVYLHDVPEDCGGATTFYPGRGSAVAYQPEAGSALLFTQDLPHEGSLVKAGIKYTLRTEAMYSPSRTKFGGRH
mmetsp:Transcript_114808/g.356584  ORF Transcript_114808/g.356584 Transcript_114808/m.356584 type:complete len:367 (-) Transcript_114808:88-1188(-)